MWADSFAQIRIRSGRKAGIRKEEIFSWGLHRCRRTRLHLGKAVPPYYSDISIAKATKYPPQFWQEAGSITGSWFRQKMNLNPNCRTRGALPFALVVTVPKFELLISLFGAPKITVLKRLNAS